MYIDYVRVYQRSDITDGVTCNPKSHPTTDYINKYAVYALPSPLTKIYPDSSHLNAYSNPNLTTWEQAGYTFPRNSLYNGC